MGAKPRPPRTARAKAQYPAVERRLAHHTLWPQHEGPSGGELWPVWGASQVYCFFNYSNENYTNEALRLVRQSQYLRLPGKNCPIHRHGRRPRSLPGRATCSARSVYAHGCAEGGVLPLPFKEDGESVSRGGSVLSFRPSASSAAAVNSAMKR